MEIIKGRVLTVGTGNNESKVRVAPVDDIDAVSPYIQVPKHLKDENILKGDAVAYVLFSDRTGVIIAKM
ncbi:MAG: hypothetical protein MRZ45_09180 [Blautia sp.]|nr:hypothetical protein [Blautia sp.]